MEAISTILVLALATTPACAVPDRVLSCHNGDTCTAETGQGVVKVRLAEIDAPEVGQPYGTEARYVLCAMICGRDVDKEPRSTSYNRIVRLFRIYDIETSGAFVRVGVGGIIRSTISPR